jgi:protein-disulfide isomerase
MSSRGKQNPLRALAERKHLWAVVPLIALIAGLVVFGSRSAETVGIPAADAATTAPAPGAAILVAETTAPPAAAAPAPAAPAAAPAATAADTKSSFSPEQKKDIEKIIKDYLVANPEVFVEIQNALEAKLEKEQAEKLKVAISENAASIYRAPNASIAGNPNGDITVVEFFDYNCGYCKRGLHDVIKLVDKDTKVRLVFKELPILSKGSEEASHVALAAGHQGKYWEMHRALLESKAHVNEAAALKIAEKLGLDMDKLKADMNSPEVKAEIEKSEALAKKMGVNGTPHFLVGDRSIAGAPDDLYDQLERNVTELRKQGCAYC